MVRVIDIEANIPASVLPPLPYEEDVRTVQGSGHTFLGREPQTIAGHGISNYDNILSSRK